MGLIIKMLLLTVFIFIVSGCADMTAEEIRANLYGTKSNFHTHNLPNYNDNNTNTNTIILKSNNITAHILQMIII